MSLEILEKLQMDVERRIIYITDEIDKGTKFRLSVCLSFLEKFDADINIYINSPGGCLVSSLAMYDIIKSCKNKVNGYVVGEACSGASLILQACDTRYITKHSSIMVHYGTHGLPSDIPKNNENLLNYYYSLQDDMVRIYQSKMKVNGRKIKKKALAEILSYDTYFRSKQSIDLNLADSVANPPLEFYEYEDEEPEITDDELNLILKQLGAE